MTEPSSSSQSPAAPHALSTTERRRLAWAAAAILLSLLLSVAILRFYRISEIPRQLFQSEAAHGVNALEVLEGKHAVYFPQRNGREGLIVYAVASAVSLLGRTVLAVRLPAAVAGAATVFAVFWLGWLLFKQDEGGCPVPWRGLCIGGLAAAMMATSLSQTLNGRVAFRGHFLALLLTLCLALLWSGWTNRSWWRFALAGVCAGLLQYTYIAARFTPLLIVLFGITLLVPWLKSKSRAAATEGLSFLSYLRTFPPSLRAELLGVGLFLALAWTVAAPILLYYLQHPNAFFGCGTQRVLQCGGYWIVDHFGDCGSPVFLLPGLLHHLSAFALRGEQAWPGGFTGLPMLRPWELLFFLLGAATALYRIRSRPAYRLLILWLGLLLLPAAGGPEYGFPLPDSLRMIGLVPAAYLLIGVGIWQALQTLYVGMRAATSPALGILRPINPRAAIAAGATIAAGLILVQGVYTWHTYFRLSAPAPAVSESSYETFLGDLARELNTRHSGPGTLYLVPTEFGYEPSLSSNCTFSYLYRGAASVHSISPDLNPSIQDPSRPVRGVGILRAAQKASEVRLLQARSAGGFIEHGNIPLNSLLREYGRYAGSEEFDSFIVHSYTDFFSDQPWAFLDRLEPPSVRYDGRITLQGIALGLQQEQLDVEQLITLAQDRSLWALFRWYTSVTLNVDYAVSLRLYNAEGENVYQKDELLRNRVDSLSTTRWPYGERIESLHILDLPAAIPPGEYQLRLVVYDSETLVPTVDNRVGRVEKTLARLKLTDAK